MRIPDRIRWAEEVLNPAPSARVLEIGCGPGAAAELLAPRLTTGRMLAIDRSAVAVARTRRRNEAHLHTGQLEARHTSLANLSAPPAAFDLAFSVDVNVFWTTDARGELAILHRLLDPGGRLAILYGPDPRPGASQTASRLDAVSAALLANGFGIDRALHNDQGSGIIARPNLQARGLRPGQIT